jgi:ubiquinone/menaquinone biosynthesis C-methylase UbiE
MRDEFFLENVRDESIIQLKTVSGKTAADIGADSGFMSEGLLNAELKVIAVETSPSMIEFLKEKFRDIDEFEALLTDAESIKLNDETVDYAFAYMYLHRTANPGESIKEIARILKHGGKAAVTDIIIHDQTELLKNYHNGLSGFSFPDLYEWFINAGFRNISIEKLNQKCTCSDPCGVGVEFDIFIACGEK